MLKLSINHDDIIANTQWAVVKFGAAWCQACSRLDTILRDIEEEGEFDGVEFYEISLDDPNSFYISSKLEVRSLPTLFIFNYGTLVSRHGLLSKEEIKSLLKAAGVPQAMKAITHDTTNI